MSREFRTTLGLIKGALSSVLAGDARLGSEAHRALLEDAEADRLKRMVEDLVATAG